jgi:hypothetical protein
MTAAQLSTYDEMLKTFYLPGIQEYLNHGTPLVDLIERNTEDVSGKNATIEAHYGRTTGTGYRGDMGVLPTANYQKHKTCTVPMKYGYGRMQVSGPSKAATRDERGAYAKVIDTEVKGLTRDFMKEKNRAMWGCGYGILARWRSGATTAITLQKKYTGNSAGGDAFGSTFGGKYLENRPDAVPVVGSTFGGAATFVVDGTDIAVSALTKGTDYDTITCTDADVTEAAGTFYVRPAGLGAQAASGAHRVEMMGLRGLITDTDLDEIALDDGQASGEGASGFPDPLQGLAVATYPWFKSKVDSHPSGRYNGQRALTLNLMQVMFDLIEEQAGVGYGPDLLLTTRALRREYIELMRADRSIVNTMTLDGGWDAISYNGVPFMVDNDAIDGEIYYLTLSEIAMYAMSAVDWMSDDGSILSRISGYDAYEAVLYEYAELGIKNRANCGVITDLAYTKSSNEGYGA